MQKMRALEKPLDTLATFRPMEGIQLARTQRDGHIYLTALAEN